MPAYLFPGTWDSAYHTTAEATKHIAGATVSYATAVATSGIGQAGLAVGHATLSSGNKAARFAAQKAVSYIAPSLPDKLPRFASRWLRGPIKPEKEDKKGKGKAKQGASIPTKAQILVDEADSY